MYRIIGADGKEYGPITLDQIQKWIAEGRLNSLSRVRTSEAGEWKTLGDYPELAALLPGRTPPPVGAPGPMPPLSIPPGPQEQGLAVTSLVLGILSFFCLLFTGIPAIICGHIAHSKARKHPERYGGAGLALAGLICGYLSLAFSLLALPAMLLPAFSKAKQRAEAISCSNNMKQIGLAYRMWSLDHGDQFPWETTRTNGGTMEVALPGGDVIDPNPVHFQVISNELVTPRVLVCPSDKSRTPALTFHNLQATNISYQLHVGTNFAGNNPQQVLLVCPIHGNILYRDGSVHLTNSRASRPRPRSPGF